MNKLDKVRDPAHVALSVRTMTVADVRDALRLGLADFMAIPTHGVLFGLFYAIAGLLLVTVVVERALLPLIVPLVGGFALLGPFASVGFYALSKRRDSGAETRWWHMLEGYRTAAAGSLLGLGLVLAAIFLLWMVVAAGLTDLLLGPLPTAIPAALGVLFASTEGWTLMLVGGVVGLGFALFVFAISVVAFPLILDREIDAITAANTSIRAVRLNPGPMVAWALIVAVLLGFGALPVLLGLPVVLPVLGHATWHLYRKVMPD
ncbi:MAG: DUF2189 domain-containing protein [Pseudomonadota bacterium]